ncbi:MAG: LysM peptidoglycan-binding domain-containing protein [Anaerolineae bacterium]|nr:LysM peptidoglycan-binding domain-containing protein [Anaerolineae bacterium]
MKIMRPLLMTIALIAVLFAGLGARTAAAQGQCGPNVTHIVQQGENLFRISLNYGTHYSVVAAYNGIYDPTRIYPGQRLVMVCASGGPVNYGTNTTTNTQPTTTVLQPPPPGQPVDVPVIPPVVDCSRFRVTSPRDGFTYGTQTFYWDGAPGATSYRVLVYSYDVNPGSLVAVSEVSGLETSTSLPMGVGYVGPGFRFSYTVQALVADSVVCSTPLLTMYREVPPDAPAPAPTLAP